MYSNGEKLTEDLHFQDHIDCIVPIQIYMNQQHSDIGFIEKYGSGYVKVNDTFYNRDTYVFISRPGY
jgi:hypothetical protein